MHALRLLHHQRIRDGEKSHILGDGFEAINAFAHHRSQLRKTDLSFVYWAD